MQEVRQLGKITRFIRRSRFLQSHNRNFPKKIDQKKCDKFLSKDKIKEHVVLETMNESCKCSIVNDQSFVGRYGPLISKLSHSRDLDTNGYYLRFFAYKALSNLMVIDRKYCNDNIALLFNLIQKEKYNDNIRQILLSRVGDLIVRWPNIFEPWKQNIAFLFFDSDVLMRKKSILVISRLLINGVIKSKEYCNELAKCVVDVDETVRGLVRLLFFELGRRNVKQHISFTDIIPYLFCRNMGRKLFRAIAIFMMKFITKEQEKQKFIDKLTAWIKTNRDANMNIDAIFCLSNLNFSEKNITTLQEFIQGIEAVSEKLQI